MLGVCWAWGRLAVHAEGLVVTVWGYFFLVIVLSGLIDEMLYH
jgi:hypothetical protein